MWRKRILVFVMGLILASVSCNYFAGAVSAQGIDGTEDDVKEPENNADDVNGGDTADVIDNAGEDLGSGGDQADQNTQDDQNVQDDQNIQDGQNDKASGDDGETNDEEEIETLAASAAIYYRAHVRNIGWMTEVGGGKQVGTTGRALPIEAFRIRLENVSDGAVQYQAKPLGMKWQDPVKNNAISGTVGKATSIEALKISLSGKVAEEYDIYYRVHVANIGWLGWTRNGEIAGSEYYNYAIEALQIQLVKKGEKAPTEGVAYKRNSLGVSYSAHVKNIGWQKAVKNGATGGTTGKALHVESVKIEILNGTASDVTYRTKSLGQAWQGWKTGGAIAGTVGKNLGLEAIEVKLSDELSKEYDIYYRAHVANIGWLGWTNNGKTAGSRFYGYPIEALQIKIYEKGKGPTVSSNAYKSAVPSVSYRAHVQNIGWQNTVKNGATAGTVGKNLNVEAVRLEILNGDANSTISYRTRGVGGAWRGWVSSNAVSGTVGRNLATEAIEIKLSDELSKTYDVYYRVHSEYFGWLGWTKNGASAGTEKYGYAIQAIQVKILKKTDTSIKAGTAYQVCPTLTYQAHVSNIGWQSAVTNGATAGATGAAYQIEALKINLSDLNTVSGGIEYRTNPVGTVEDWDPWKTNGGQAGTTGQAKNIEAVQIRLTGALSNYADVFYRVYVPNMGWLGWTKNGLSAGTSFYNYGIRAIQIKLVRKGQTAIATGDAFRLGASYGIDVSSYQGTIDWSKVSKSGKSFAMIRALSGTMGNITVDSQFVANMKNATKNGVAVGVYRYGYAMTVAQAQQEATKVVQAIKASGVRPMLPVAYDVEDTDTQGKLSQAQLTKIIDAFRVVIENNGYKFMIYTGKYWMESGKVDMNHFANTDMWIASWNNDGTPNLGHGYTGKGNITIWQYSSKGSVPGIYGYVDMDVCYKTYWK